MAVLNKEQILAAADIATEEVEVPEWGGSVIVKAMSGSDRDAFDLLIIQPDSEGKMRPALENARAKLLVMSLVDEHGKRLFSLKDIEALGKKNAAILDRLYDMASRLSGISKADVDELAKNSVGAQNGASGSD